MLCWNDMGTTEISAISLLWILAQGTKICNEKNRNFYKKIINFGYHLVPFVL